MKVQTLILGDYGATSTFRLYRFPMPLSPPLTSSSNSPSTLGSKQDHAAMYYYCLEDLERLCVLAPTSSLRDINTVQLYRDFPSTFCKNANDGHTYANTQVLYDLATRFKCSLLIDLCQLTEHTPIDQLCSTLQRIPQLDIQKLLLHQQKRQTVPSLSSINNDIHMRLVEQVLNPVRLDGQEWFLQPWIQQQQCQQNQPLVIRLSPPQEENDQPDLDFSNAESNNVSHTRTKQSSLLLQRRLAPKLGHHAPHLSINTPVYNDHHLHSIKSAPLRKSMSKHHINKRLQAAAAAAAAAATNNSHHSTTPPRLHQLLMTSNTSRPHRQYHIPSSPTVPSSLITPTTKKQQFLQPFEHLFDTLEHTRGQKTKLDDTIRQSSTLISKLQQQTTPKMVADKVAEQMEIWMTPYLAQMQHCVDRLEGLEEKWNARICAQQQSGPKSRSTITMNNNDDITTRKAELAELMRRLDQLEQTLVDTTGQ